MREVCLVAAALAGAQITYYLIHKWRWSTVRASSLPTLVFALAVMPWGFSFEPGLQAAFFGATFVGMTDSSRLGAKRVALASLAFAVIFIFLIPFAKGIGGGLGAAAFFSTSVIYFLSRFVQRRSL